LVSLIHLQLRFIELCRCLTLGLRRWRPSARFRVQVREGKAINMFILFSALLNILSQFLKVLLVGLATSSAGRGKFVLTM
jgi:hypothetical protein